MGDAEKIEIAKGRALYVAFVIVVLFLNLTPLNLLPGRYALPDLILIGTLAIIIRRAAYIPYWLAGSVFLIADILLSRPMGLWAMISLIAVEVIRANRMSFRDMFFATEWAVLGLMLFAMYMIQQFVLIFSLSTAFPLGGVIWQIGMAIVAYPIIVLIITKLFGIKKPTTADGSLLG